MDQNRQIRFLIPPFVLLLSVFLADFLSGLHFFSKIAEHSDKSILIFAGIGASTIPIGFLIGAVAISFWNLLGFVALKWRKKGWNYEATISDQAYRRIWSRLDIDSNVECDSRQRFFASATFDHGLLPKGINGWTMRRWNAFNTHFNCYVALMLALPVCSLFSIRITMRWLTVTIIMMIILLFNARIAYRQTIGMIEFQANRNLSKKDCS